MTLADLAELVGVEPEEVLGLEVTGTGVLTLRDGDRISSRVVRNQATVHEWGCCGAPELTEIEFSGELQFGLRLRGGAIAWTPPVSA